MRGQASKVLPTSSRRFSGVSLFGANRRRETVSPPSDIHLAERDVCVPWLRYDQGWGGWPVGSVPGAAITGHVGFPLLRIGHKHDATLNPPFARSGEVQIEPCHRQYPTPVCLPPLSPYNLGLLCQSTVQTSVDLIGCGRYESRRGRREVTEVTRKRKRARFCSQPSGCSTK